MGKNKAKVSGATTESVSSECSANSSEITRRKTLRRGHRSSAEREMEAVNEILNSCCDASSSAPNHRAPPILHRSTLREKLEIIQGLDNDIPELSEEVDVIQDIEESDVFRSRVKMVIVRLDAVRPRPALYSLERGDLQAYNITQGQSSIQKNNCLLARYRHRGRGFGPKRCVPGAHHHKRPYILGGVPSTVADVVIFRSQISRESGFHSSGC